jgi:ribose/xylose/arabinose/galactoside ABC-type transport system permease subunit
MDAIAAVVIGGTSMSGVRAPLPERWWVALIIGVLNNGLVL